MNWALALPATFVLALLAEHLLVVLANYIVRTGDAQMVLVLSISITLILSALLIARKTNNDDA